MTRAEPGAPSGKPDITRFVSRYFFYGWVIVAAGFLAQTLSSLSMQGLSTYVEPLREQFGWNAAQTAAGRSFQQVDTFLGPLNGWLADRFGPRRLMAAGVLLYMVAFAYFSQIETLYGFYAACLLMAVANSLVGLLTVSVAVNHWFRRYRSTAMGLSVMGLAAAGVVFMPILVWAQTSFGWRAAAFGSSFATLAIGLPIMIFMRDTPERHGLEPDGGEGPPASSAKPDRSGGLVHFTLRQAMRTRSFWLLTAAITAATLVQSAMIVHQFPQMERVVDRDTAAFVLAELNVFNLLGRVFGGMLGDRFAKNVLLTANLVVTTAALCVLALGDSLAALLVFGTFFGFCWGMRTALLNSLIGDYFGRTSFGKIAGVVATLASPLAIVSPVLVGIGVDQPGGYVIALLSLAAVSLVGSLLFFVSRRPDPPQEDSAPA